ncbi:MAG: GGDEF domain-containing phosphodiesterase [Planctomycetes bacterium]|nr:GGDEF domain-containing phosphodiesterase [Planctomycetota bacterium]
MSGLRARGLVAANGFADAAQVDLVIAGLQDAPTGVPWIAVVDAADGAAREQALERGATAVLSAHVDVDAVAAAVELALRELDRSRMHERLADLLARVEAAAGVGSFEYEPASGRLWLSAEARRLLGLESARVDGLVQAVTERLAPDERRRFGEWLSLVGPLQGVREFECRLAQHADAVEWVRFSVPLAPEGTRLVRGVIEEWEEPQSGAAAVAEFEVQPDARAFLGALERAVGAAWARNGSIAVYVVDSEELRAFSSGATRGNQEYVLHGLATRMRAALRDVGIPEGVDGAHVPPLFGRASAGGLVVAVQGLRRHDDVLAVGARLSSWLSKPVHVGGRELVLDATLGVTASSPECRDAEELVRRAETAAYCARRQGRKRVELWEPAMDSEAFERLSLEMALRRALSRDEFVLHYQPRVEIRTGRIVGVEALIRWQHPDLGFVAPARFIPIAEETGLIVPIGAHVMHTACRQAREWSDAGLPPVRMSVNLSPLQLHDRGLLATIEEALRTSALPADRLELELTEGALMRDPASDVQLLHQIKSLGVHLSIDDFGTGHSSLSYLRRFPVDALKIDRSFLRDATSRPDDASIFSAIVLMGRSLKMTVVAEGVETPAQLALLRVMRADEAQGFLLSPPVAADRAAALLAKGTLGQAAA